MPKGKEGFSKGDPNINRTGLNKGHGHGRKKVRWNNLQDLAEWAQDALEDINDPKVVLEYIRHKEKLLLEKISNVPSTPAESVENTKTAQSELDAAEANASNSQPGSDPVRLGAGETQIQA